jgi:hypothetical protein
MMLPLQLLLQHRMPQVVTLPPPLLLPSLPVMMM